MRSPLWVVVPTFLFSLWNNLTLHIIFHLTLTLNLASRTTFSLGFAPRGCCLRQNLMRLSDTLPDAQMLPSPDCQQYKFEISCTGSDRPNLMKSDVHSCCTFRLVSSLRPGLLLLVIIVI
jgi:hypothetical protein